MNGGTEEGVKEHSASEVVRNGLVACTLGYAFVAIAPVIVASSEVHGAAIAFWRSTMIELVCSWERSISRCLRGRS